MYKKIRELWTLSVEACKESIDARLMVASMVLSSIGLLMSLISIIFHLK